MKKLIVFEGCDGVGKSSCSMALAQKIDGIYYKTPPELFEELRRSIDETKDYTLRLYYYLTSTIYAAREIAEILKNNHVVCDRYIYSTIAYHRALGINVPRNLDELVMAPDYCFCLFTRRDVLEKRIKSRTIISTFDDNFELQDKVFKEFKNFSLKFFDTSDLQVEESVEKILKQIRLNL